MTVRNLRGRSDHRSHHSADGNRCPQKHPRVLDYPRPFQPPLAHVSHGHPGREFSNPIRSVLKPHMLVVLLVSLVVLPSPTSKVVKPYCCPHFPAPNLGHPFVVQLRQRCGKRHRGVVREDGEPRQRSPSHEEHVRLWPANGRVGHLFLVANLMVMYDDIYT